jgi:hypothetical protein
MISNATGARQHASLIEAKEMASKRPTTIAEYIRAAPGEGAAAFARLYEILKRGAGGRGDDQVGNPLLRGAPIPVRFLSTPCQIGESRGKRHDVCGGRGKQIPEFGGSLQRPDNGGKPSRGELPISAAVRFSLRCMA